MPRLLSVLVGCLATLAPLIAAEPSEDEVLAAARAANVLYQRNLALLIDQLHGPVIAARVRAIEDIARLQDPSTVPFLLPSLESGRASEEQAAAAIALGHIGSPVAKGPLRDLMDKAPSGEVRAAAMNALNDLHGMESADLLLKAKDPDPVLSGAALTDLGTMAVDKAADLLANALTHDRRQIVRRMCAIGLGRIGDKTQGVILLDALSDPDPGVRRYAAQALVQLNDTAAVPYLLMALEGNVAGEYINHCLMLLTKTDFGFDWRASDLARSAAVERGFRWWSDHAGEMSR